MAATSIYVDAPTQAEIDLLSGEIYVSSHPRDYVELPTRLPHRLLVLLRGVRCSGESEGRAVFAGAQVHGADEDPLRKGTRGNVL